MVLGVYGTKNVTRPSQARIEIAQGWYDVYDYTASSSTNRLTAPGHNFTKDLGTRVFTTGEHPYPLTGNRFAAVCDISGSSFKVVFRPGGCGGTKRMDITSTGYGENKIGVLKSGKPVVISKTIAGMPAGVTAEIWCGTRLCTDGGTRYPGKVYHSSGGNQFYLELKISSTAALGSHILKLRLEPEGDEPKDVSIPLTIATLPTVALKTPTSAPAIPTLSTWENNMTKLAAKWCNTKSPTAKMSFGTESQVWFYDGAQVYFDVAEYTKNTAWNACGLNIARQYRDYVRGLDGKVPGWRAFTSGLSTAYRMTGDPKYLDAVRLIALNGIYASGGFVRTDGTRETAYILRAMVDYEKLTGIRPPAMDDAAARMLGIFDQHFVSGTFIYQQIYMDGLAMRSLIEYWELTRDPRVPPAIKTALNWIWANGWQESSRKMYLNPEPLGPRCDWGCQYPDTELINLSAAAWAWYWSITGDTTARTRADELFTRALATDISYSGKIFSQNYTWSFQHVKWRSLLSGANR